MKPAGPERDLEIAVVRDKLCHHPFRQQIGCTIKTPTVELCNKKHKCLMFRIDPCSTDISATMELWEEMPQNTQMAKNPDGVTIIVYTHWQIHKRLKYKGNNTADAISGAYLKWRAQ